MTPISLSLRLAWLSVPCRWSNVEKDKGKEEDSDKDNDNDKDKDQYIIFSAVQSGCLWLLLPGQQRSAWQYGTLWPGRRHRNDHYYDFPCWCHFHRHIKFMNVIIIIQRQWLCSGSRTTFTLLKATETRWEMVIIITVNMIIMMITRSPLSSPDHSIWWVCMSEYIKKSCMIKIITIWSWSSSWLWWYPDHPVWWIRRCRSCLSPSCVPY